MCSQVKLEAIVRVYQAAAHHNDNEANLNRSFKSPARRSARDDAQGAGSHCARVQLLDGQELDIWMQDAAQCRQFIA